MRAWMRLRLTMLVAATATLAVLVAMAPAIAAPLSAAPLSAAPLGGTVHYAVDEPACTTQAVPGTARCFAVKRVMVAKGTAGARAFTTPASVPLGPAGGYTPADLATAYGYNPDLPAATQLVALIDWYDDPNALADLDAFDAHYGLAQETSTSFTKVNQDGAPGPLPQPDSGTSVEIALDIEAVRSVCHTCRILLVEANDNTYDNLGAAENTAATLGATEISNSFGGPEAGFSPSVLAAFNHPGVVITASTGDDGWYGWDNANYGYGADDAASFPASDPDVVAVGGTKLVLNGDGSRVTETVWNGNGQQDSAQNGLGATGGGCSTQFAAQPWQAAYPGYAAAGCHGKRLAADISADADPTTGFDVLDSYAYGPNGWLTVGGTSLSAPVTAALFALAGGSGGAAYPAATLYANGTSRAYALRDVTQGGSGYCGGIPAATCFNDTFTYYHTHNPNALGYGDLDCSFPRSTADLRTAPHLSSECNAVPGYDGASGLGTPVGLGLFSTAPLATITRPAHLTLRTAASFTAAVRQPVAGRHVTSYAWTWGDGQSNRTSTAAVGHSYTRSGTFTVTLTVTDTAGQVAATHTSVTLGRAALVHYGGPAKLQLAHPGTFSVAGTTDPNTGGRITSVLWRWGDGTTSTATAATHRYARAGTFAVTVTLTDNTGVRTSLVRRVSVIR
jgi:hypothetical protein